jgi:uncharacterized protein (TIGR03067 family)
MAAVGQPFQADGDLRNDIHPRLILKRGSVRLERLTYGRTIMLFEKSRLLVALPIIACAFTAPIRAAEKNADTGKTQSPADLAKLDGVWILADTNAAKWFSWASNSKLTIRDGKFFISRFCETSKGLRGRFKLEPASTPQAVDITTEPVDLSERWDSWGYPAFNAAGIYKLDGNRLTVCVNKSSKSPRPTSLAPNEADRTMMFSFVRAPADFREFPNDITVHATDPAGKPIVGAELFTHMFIYSNAKAQRVWRNGEGLGTTGPDGIARAPYDKVDGQPIILRDKKRALMAMLPISPAGAVQGAMHVVLRPESHVHFRLHWNATIDAGKPIGWSVCSLNFRGARIAQNIDPPGSSYEFHVPPGEYEFVVHGERFERRSTKITVPAGRSDYEAPPVLLNMSKLALLEGKQAPELAGVVAWRGTPVKLSELKGKYVLLDFWGYWCGRA